MCKIILSKRGGHLRFFKICIKALFSQNIVNESPNKYDLFLSQNIVNESPNKYNLFLSQNIVNESPNKYNLFLSQA